MIDSIKIELGGKERNIKFDLGIMSDYEDLTGVDALNTDIFTGISAKKLMSLLFVVLKDSDPELTIKECGKMVSAANMAAVIKVLGEAFMLGMPKPDASKKKA